MDTRLSLMLDASNPLYIKRYFSPYSIYDIDVFQIPIFYAFVIYNLGGDYYCKLLKIPKFVGL